MRFRPFFALVLFVAQTLFAVDLLNSEGRELLRVVPPESAIGQEFEARMRDLIFRLDKNAKAHGADQTRFLLLAEDRTEGFYAPVKPQPVMAFSVGMLRQMGSVDAFAGIVGHEWFHHLAKTKNSAGQETAADLFGLKVVADAGFSVNEAMAGLERLFGTSRQVKSQNLNSRYIPGDWFFDVHLLDHNRLKLLQQEAAALSLQRGGFADIPVTPYAGVYAEALTKPRWELQSSWLDAAIPPEKWNAADFTRKIEILRGALPQIPDLQGKRGADLVERLRTLAPRSESENRLLTQLVDESIFPELSHSPVARFAYDSLVSRPGGIGTAISNLKTQTERFISATNLDSAKAAADSLISAIDQLALSSEARAFLRKLDLLPTFPFPDVTNPSRIRKGKGPIVSWQPHTEWAEKDPSGAIFQSLLSLGTLDARWKESGRIRAAASRFQWISQGPQSREASSGQLVLDEDGRVRRVREEDVWTLSAHLDRSRIAASKPEPVSLKQIAKKMDEVVEDDRVAGGKARALYRQEVLELLRAAVQGNRSANTKFKDLPLPFKLKSGRLEVLGGGPIGPEYAFSHPEVFFAFNQPALTALGLAYDPFIEEGYMDLTEESFIQSDMERWARLFDSLLERGNERVKKAVRELFLGETALIRENSFATLDRYILAPDTDWTDVSLNPIQAMMLKHTPGVFSLSETLQWSGDSKVFKIHPDISRLFLNAYRPLFALQSPSGSVETLFQNVSAMLRRPEAFAKALAVSELYDFYDLWIDPASDLKGFNVEGIFRLFQPSELEGNTALIKLFRSHVAAKTDWPKKTPSLTQDWLLYHRLGLFPTDGALESKILKTILAGTAKLKTGKSRRDILYSLMKVGKIKSPKLQKQLTKTFITELTHELNVDDGSKQYHDRLVSRLKEWNQTLPLENKVSFLSQLADRLEFQHPLSQAIAQILQDSLRSDDVGKNSSIAAIIGQSGLEQIRRFPEERKELLRFLAGPRTSQNTARAAEVISSFRTSERDNWSQQSIELREDELRHRANQVHEQFWAAPFAARVSLLDELLFPASPLKAERELDNNREMLELAIDLAFPRGEPYAENAREFLEAYLQVVDENQKGLFVGALLGAVEKGRVADDQRTLAGEKLALILETMGPAETKLGQAINSHPDTPEDIREGTAETKKNAAPLLRWELTEVIDGLPDEIKSQIKRVGSVLGSASFFVTVNVELKDGTEAVLRLQRPYSERRSKLGFERLGRMLEILKNKVSERTRLIYRQMIGQATQMAKVEISPELSLAQKDKLDELYDRSEIKVPKGMPIKIRTARVLAAGPGYWLMEKAPGVHFNDLPNRTPRQKEVRQEYARSLFFHELLNLLRGGHFDTDRHGAQMRIDLKNRTITHFDAGGVVLSPPTGAEKQRLGEVLFEMVSRQNENTKGELQSVLADSIRQDQEAGRDFSYLLDVQKFLLNTSDFHRQLTPQDREELLLSVVRQGEVDSEILEGFGRAFAAASPETQKSMSGMMERGNERCWSLTRQLAQ